MCPLVPPERLSWSPYSGTDANCGNTLLIDVDDLVDDGLLDIHERPAYQPFSYRTDFSKVASWKDGLLLKAARRLNEAATPAAQKLKREMGAFRSHHSAWLEDSAL